MCNICNDLYIGQTMNNFTKRWNAHKNIRKNNKTKFNHEIKNHFALIIHYKKFHKDNIPQEIKNAYTVQFLTNLVRSASSFSFYPSIHTEPKSRSKNLSSLFKNAKPSRSLRPNIISALNTDCRCEGCSSIDAITQKFITI